MTYEAFVDGEQGVHEAINARLVQMETGITGKSPPTGAMMAWGGDSAPTGWLLCDGSAVSRTTYAALFAVIGTTFGAGDGSTTFNLPDLRGRAAGGTGQGSGLTNRTQGEQAGEESHQLTVDELPSHTHTNPTSTLNAAASLSSSFELGSSTDSGATGSDQAHNNMQPSLVLNFVIRS